MIIIIDQLIPIVNTRKVVQKIKFPKGITN